MFSSLVRTIARWLPIGVCALCVALAPIQAALAAPPAAPTLAVAAAVAPAGVYYPLLDEQGSLRALTSSSGTVTLRQNYGPWGDMRQRSGDASLTNLGWAGERSGSADGLTWLRARHYGPRLGRFLQRDTIVGTLARPQSLHRYAGLEGNPVNATDPSGHCLGYAVRPNMRDRLAAPRGSIFIGGYLQARQDDAPYCDERGRFPAGIGSRSELQEASTRTNRSLFQDLNGELGGFGGNLARQIVRRFVRNDPRPLFHAPSSQMAHEVKETQAYHSTVWEVTHEIHKQLGKHQSHAGLSLSADFLSRVRANWPFYNPLTYGLKTAVSGAIGGTKGLSLRISDYQYNHKRRSYSYRLWVTIYDVFGANNNDTYSPGLRALWLLQHQRGFASFYNVIQTSVRVYGFHGDRYGGGSSVQFWKD